jgi:hypothetical protein
MAWRTRFATIKAPACAITGIHGVNLSFTIRQSRMKQLRISDPRRGRLIGRHPVRSWFAVHELCVVFDQLTIALWPCPEPIQ